MQIIENFFFEPIKCTSYNNKKIIKIDNNYIYFDSISTDKKYDLSRCLLVARDNYGNLQQPQTRKQLDFLREIYPEYDIYMCEYPGFGAMGNSTSIEGSINILFYWLQKLKSRYTNIDCLGIGLGAGILVEMLYKNRLFVSDLYIMSSFTKFIDAVKNASECGYGFLKTIPKYNDMFNTIDHVSQLNIERVFIIHSKVDTIIPYSHALELHAKIISDGKVAQVEFIEIDGDHKSPKILHRPITN